MHDVFALADASQRENVLVVRRTACDENSTAVARRGEGREIERLVVRTSVAFLPADERAHRQIGMRSFGGREKMIG